MGSTNQLPRDCPQSIRELLSEPIDASFSAVELDSWSGTTGAKDNERHRWVSASLVIDRWPSLELAVAALANQRQLGEELGEINGSVQMLYPGAEPNQVHGDGGELPSNWTVLDRTASWPGSMVAYHPDPGALTIGIGESLRTLHQLDTNNPNRFQLVGSPGWEHLATQVRNRLSADDFDPMTLREPYSRYQADQLLDMFESGRPSDEAGSLESEVISHGNFRPANVLVSGGVPAGFLGLSAMRVIDRHFDLAQMHLAISAQLGPEAVFGFYEGYGSDPNLVAIDHYVFAHSLLSVS